MQWPKTGGGGFLCDVNGHGKADAVLFLMPEGFCWCMVCCVEWQPANSCWRTGHGANSTSQMLGDVNGDGKADAVTYSIILR